MVYVHSLSTSKPEHGTPLRPGGFIRVYRQMNSDVQLKRREFMTKLA